MANSRTGDKEHDGENQKSRHKIRILNLFRIIFEEDHTGNIKFIRKNSIEVVHGI